MSSTVVDGSWGGGCRWFSNVRLGVVEHVSDMPDGIDAACAHLLSCCATDTWMCVHQLGPIHITKIRW